MPLKQDALYFAKICQSAYTRDVSEFDFKDYQPFHGLDTTYGYVATTQDDKVIISFRGTDDILNWLSNLDFGQANWVDGPVHDGFLDSFESIYPKLKYLESHPNLYITGHSLGGALATLATKALNPLATYTFGQPRVGSIQWANNFKNTNFYRFVNAGDWIPEIPPYWSILWFFKHVGTPYSIDQKGNISPTYFFNQNDITYDVLMYGVQRHDYATYVKVLGG